jgi:hypothetical protein
MSESPRKKQPGGWLTKKERDAMRPKYDIDDYPMIVAQINATVAGRR